jgi:hypothetical protein
MEELRKLVFEFKISVSDFDEPISEEVKNRIKNLIENYNNIVSSIKLENLKLENPDDYQEFRSFWFKVATLRKLAKSYKIDVPDLIDKP